MVNDKMLRQQIPGLQGEVGHGIEIVCGALPKPFINLISAKCPIAPIHKKLAELVFGKCPDIFFCCLGHDLKVNSGGVMGPVRIYWNAR